MKRWETHVHTTEGSACATADAAEMARTCKENGYDGMFVTDHFYHGNTSVDRNLPWEEWVRRFSLGYHHAKIAGDEIGLAVDYGWEYSWNGNDFLTYGLTFEWLVSHPEVIAIEPFEYLRLVREHGGLIVHAHPFRQEWYVKSIRLVPDLVDAVEVYNGGNSVESYNLRADWYADSYGLPKVSGSDTHKAGLFRGGILTDSDQMSSAIYGQLVRSERVKGVLWNQNEIVF